MGNPELNIGDSMLGENLVWMYDSNGCIVSTSHKLNKDGYLRVRDHRVLVSLFQLLAGGLGNGSVETRCKP